MKDIKLNGYTHRLYALSEIKANTEKSIKEMEGPNAPFSSASYSGALEAHYSMLSEFVERLVKDSEKLEFIKEFNRLVEEKAQDTYLLYKNGCRYV